MKNTFLEYFKVDKGNIMITDLSSFDYKKFIPKKYYTDSKYYDKITVPDDSRLDQLAFTYLGNEDYWDIIFLMNKMENVLCLPVNPQTLEEIIESKYQNSSYELDLKIRIKNIFNSKYIGEFNKTYNYTKGQIVSISGPLKKHYYITNTDIILDNDSYGVLPSKSINWNEFRLPENDIRNEEIDLNEKYRVIKILKPRYLSEVLSLKKKINQKINRTIYDYNFKGVKAKTVKNNPVFQDRVTFYFMSGDIYIPDIDAGFPLSPIYEDRYVDTYGDDTSYEVPPTDIIDFEGDPIGADYLDKLEDLTNKINDIVIPEYPEMPDVPSLEDIIAGVISSLPSTDYPTIDEIIAAIPTYDVLNLDEIVNGVISSLPNAEYPSLEDIKNSIQIPAGPSIEDIVSGVIDSLPGNDYPTIDEIIDAMPSYDNPTLEDIVSGVVSSLPSANYPTIDEIIDAMPAFDTPTLDEIINGVIDSLPGNDYPTIDEIKAAIDIPVMPTLDEIISGVIDSLPSNDYPTIDEIKNAINIPIGPNLDDIVSGVISSLPSTDYPTVDEIVSAIELPSIPSIDDIVAGVIDSLPNAEYPTIDEIKAAIQIPDYPEIPEYPTIDEIKAALEQPEIPDYTDQINSLMDKIKEIEDLLNTPEDPDANLCDLGFDIVHEVISIDGGSGNLSYTPYKSSIIEAYLDGYGELIKGLSYTLNDNVITLTSELLDEVQANAVYAIYLKDMKQ